MFVADTNIISLTDPLKALRGSQAIDLEDSTIFLTTITVAEVATGIRRLERLGSSRKAADLANWWADVECAYKTRILPFDIASARIAGDLADRAAALGHSPGWADIQIAAIAAARSFMVLTRNARHFAPIGVPHMDPFAETPPD